MKANNIKGQAGKKRGSVAYMAEQIRVEGIIRRSDPDSPLAYGSHYVEQEGFFYVLSSEDVDLNEYERRPMKLYGTMVEGSSDENGPQRLRVTEIGPLYY